jgi:hypothetical protein
MKLSQLSMLCMLSTVVLDNFVPDQGSPGEMSLGMERLLTLLLLVLPGIGTVLGVMSWRKERHTGWTIAIIVFNILLALLGLIRLILSLSAG